MPVDGTAFMFMGRQRQTCRTSGYFGQSDATRRRASSTLRHRRADSTRDGAQSQSRRHKTKPKMLLFDYFEAFPVEVDPIPTQTLNAARTSNVPSNYPEWTVVAHVISR